MGTWGHFTGTKCLAGAWLGPAGHSLVALLGVCGTGTGAHLETPEDVGLRDARSSVLGWFSRREGQGDGHPGAGQV